MSALPTRKWLAVHSHPHAEVKAAGHLQRQGFEIYLPRYLKRRRHARRVDTVGSPLFPRYLFVSVDMAAQRWRAIQSTVGVAQLVRCGDRVAPVPDAIIAGLRSREDQSGYIRLAPRYAPGDKVRIMEGAFSATLGLFESVSDGERVAILLDLLGRKVRVVVHAGMIEAA